MYVLVEAFVAVGVDVGTKVAAGGIEIGGVEVGGNVTEIEQEENKIVRIASDKKARISGLSKKKSTLFLLAT